MWILENPSMAYPVIIEFETGLPLGTSALFLFTNKQRDKVKVL
ncbi:transposase [Vibrio diazotrophicus]|nr:transposase [Vibrio diazotrophicus]